MPLQLGKAFSEGFHGEITCKTRVVNAKWLSTSSFSHYCLISCEQFSEAEEQSKKRGSVCTTGFEDVIYEKSDSLPWHKSHIGPKGYLVHSEFHNPSLPLITTYCTCKRVVQISTVSTDGVRQGNNLALLFRICCTFRNITHCFSRNMLLLSCLQ